MASSSQSSRSRTCTPAATTDAALARCPVVPFDDERNEGAHDKEERAELRRGPWTVDEDLALVNYITDHGEGRWNALAPAAGLKRTGKSCRLRWLNYLRPDVKRGFFTADEHLLILDLHSRYGNRWSRIAQHLPGRTDNEIKNYWRTRVQKHAKQLNCDANSQRFKDAMRYLWTPSLVDSHRFLNANAAGSDHQDDGYYLTAALSGVGVTYPSSDSLVTTTSEPHDASFPARKWGELYSYADVRAGEETMAVSSGDWCAARETSQQQAPGMMWPGEQKAAQAVRGAGARFEDPELSGWVQSFSEVVDATESSFWTLDDVWKTQ